VQSIPPLSNGRYTLSRTLGKGGMATVYGGFDTMLEVDRAVKVLSPELCSSDKLRKRFLAEARAMARLRHPNIVTVFDVGIDGETPYIVMEMVDGGAVMDWVERDGPQPPEVAGHIILAALAGLQASHDRGVIHRDMKPHNLLISSDGRVKITDFGIAQLEDDRSFTKTGAIMGTLAYMPPEQRESAKGLGPSADVFASGASLYAILTSREPFDIYNESLHAKLFASVPGPMRRVILKACQYEPAMRYQTASAMSADLREAMLEMGIEVERNLLVPLTADGPVTMFSTEEVDRPSEPVQNRPESTTIYPEEPWLTTHEAFTDEETEDVSQSEEAVPSNWSFNGVMMGLFGLFFALAAVFYLQPSGDSGTDVSSHSEVAETTEVGSTPEDVQDVPTGGKEESLEVKTVDPPPPESQGVQKPPAVTPQVVKETATVAQPEESDPVEVPEKVETPPVEATSVTPEPVQEAIVEDGRLLVRIMPPDGAAWLQIDGSAVKVTKGKADLSLPAGTHKLLLGSGKRSGSKNVQITAGATKSVCWKFNADGTQGDCRAGRSSKPR
jgi:serine/threonine protein kinase